jgi:hypothetical protein
MKKVIEVLENAKESALSGSRSTAVSCIEEALVELKTPRWIPYKNLTKAHDYLSEATKAVEDVTFRSRDEEKRIKTALNRIECAMGAVETMIPLPLPRWETPDQWEKRTGKAWPEDWPVWNITKEMIGISTMAEEAERKKWGNHIYVCATEAGPPPDDWWPEEEK